MTFMRNKENQSNWRKKTPEIPLYFAIVAILVKYKRNSSKLGKSEWDAEKIHLLLLNEYKAESLSEFASGRTCMLSLQANLEFPRHQELAKESMERSNTPDLFLDLNLDF